MSTLKLRTLESGALAMLMLCVGCASHRGRQPKHRNHLLSQSEVLKEFIAGSEYIMTGTEPDKSRNSSDFWLLPKGSNPTYSQLDDRLLDLAGGGNMLWKYSSPEMKLDCYINSGVSPAFPVTSRGLTMKIQCLAPYEVEAENIYLADSDSLLATYDTDKLSEAGWRHVDKNTFEFSIQPNRSGEERLWHIKVYYKNLNFYDDTWYPPVEENEVARKKWDIARLQFIQVTDTVYPERAFTNDTWINDIRKEGNLKYQQFIPNLLIKSRNK